MTRIRLKFGKHGPLRFVGHLDFMRYCQKLMRRAGVDVAYSEGFSPHPLMSFALPLSVGATSDGEYLDLALNSFRDVRTDAPESASPDERELMRRLNGVCREGMRILDVLRLPDGAKNAMTAVAACSWQVRFSKEALPPEIESEDLAAHFRGFLDGERMPAVKKTKKGLRETDLKPMVYRAETGPDGTYGLLLKSGSEDHVKPALLMGAFLRAMKIPARYTQEGVDELYPSGLVMHRLETYAEELTDGQRFLVPLIDHGDGERIACGA